MSASSSSLGQVHARIPPTFVVDTARGLAMIVVLYGHALEVLFEQRSDGRVFDEAFVQYKAMAAFAMAVFFVVSGVAGASIANKKWRTVIRTSLFLVALAYLVHFSGLLLRLVEILLTGNGDLAGELLAGFEAALKGRGFSTVVVWFLVSLAVVRLIVCALFKTLEHRQALVAVACIGLASAAVPFVPNAFMAKTWSVGVVFFTLGMLLAPHIGRFTQPSALYLVGLLPLCFWLALQNGGCPYDFSATCPLLHPGGETVVWVHMGEYGFIPLFWAAALAGSLGVFALAGVLARRGSAGPLAYIGQRTMGILIINGFVLVFLQRWLKAVPLESVPLAIYPVLLICVVVLHLAALRALHHPLHALNIGAAKLADAAIAQMEPVLPGVLGAKPKPSGARTRKQEVDAA